MVTFVSLIVVDPSQVLFVPKQVGFGGALIALLLSRETLRFGFFEVLGRNRYGSLLEVVDESFPLTAAHSHRLPADEFVSNSPTHPIDPSLLPDVAIPLLFAFE